MADGPFLPQSSLPKSSTLLRSLSEYTRIGKYSQHVDGRRETWKETIDGRVMWMHEQKYGELLDPIREAFEDARMLLHERKILGSARSLQFGGSAILKKNSRIFNCFSRDTSFVTREGVRSFEDFDQGEEVVVLTHRGNWKKGTVKNYGRQALNKITISRGNVSYSVKVTEDHRWLLHEGVETTSLEEGHHILPAPDLLSSFDYDSAEPMERLYWAYGFVYGDGTVVHSGNNDYSMVRLCGYDKAYTYRFEELGFKTSSPVSIKGDFIAYTGTYLKTTPDPKVDPPELIRAFVRGYLDADGTKNKSGSPRKFDGIQSSDPDHIKFIRECFPIAGVYLVSETDLTGQETNFSPDGRPETSFFRINDYFGHSLAHFFTVKNIERTGIIEDVWCLEVEEDASFVLPFGVSTGNCIGNHLDRPRAFQEMFWLLLCGCGVGFSVQRHHVARIPSLLRPSDSPVVYQIPDTIEGWADSLGVLLSSYLVDDHPFPEFAGRRVRFDASLVRPKGAPLSSGSKAPGPEPLLRALELVRRRLDEVVGREDRKLRPIDAYDLAMYASDAVLAGGVRRSASLAMFSVDDDEMMRAKSEYGWWDKHPQRQRSNNSAALLRDQTSWEDWSRLMETNRKNGEPGGIWVSSREEAYNPCVEASFLPTLRVPDTTDLTPLVLPGSRSGVVHRPDLHEIHLSGIQACNLCTINGSRCEGEEDFYRACDGASLLGTLQAGYTDLGYLGPVSEQIVRREALLGVSITGISDRPDLLLDPDVLEGGARRVLSTNQIVATAIGIRPTARATCIKPEGTGSLVMGTLAQGVHPWPFRRGIKHVQANVLETSYQWFSHHNPHAVYSLLPSNPNRDNTVVLGFPIEAPEGASVWTDTSALTVLERVRTIRRHWIEAGTVPERCAEPQIRHNVSNTIYVDDHEWEAVTKFVYDHREDFAGVSFLPRRGDRAYHLAPYTQVFTRVEICERRGESIVVGAEALLDAMPTSFQDPWVGIGIAVSGEGRSTRTLEEQEWLLAFDLFVSVLCSKLTSSVDSSVVNPTTSDGVVREFIGDTIKDLVVWRKWQDLTSKTVEVPWDRFREVDDQVDFGLEAACAGGGCDVDWSSLLAQTQPSAK